MLVGVRAETTKHENHWTGWGYESGILSLRYGLINEQTKRRIGGHHNALSLMITVDFAEVERNQFPTVWQLLFRNAAAKYDDGRFRQRISHIWAALYR